MPRGYRGGGSQGKGGLHGALLMNPPEDVAERELRESRSANAHMLRRHPSRVCERVHTPHTAERRDPRNRLRDHQAPAGTISECACRWRGKLGTLGERMTRRPVDVELGAEAPELKPGSPDALRGGCTCDP